jgi:gliding-associated putative ABC transporter substrate-binding component GldG
MNKKDLKKDTIIKFLIIIAIVVAFNIIMTRVFTRLDLTKNQSFTLTQVSRDMVGGLNDRLVIKAFISDNLPPPFNNVKSQVRDMLNDYRSYSKGNLTFEFYNPTGEGDTTLEREAQKFGIPALTIPSYDKDKAGYVKGFIGLVFEYQGKRETVPYIQASDNVEYVVSSKLKKIVNDKRIKIGFLTGHGEYDITKEQSIYKSLTETYDVVQVNVAENRPVPIDISVLIVLGPKQPFPEAHKFMIDQFIMRGGNIAWCLNKFTPNSQQNMPEMLFADFMKLELDDQLNSYGLKLNEDAVRDLQCAQILVQTQYEGFFKPSDNQFFPIITNIDKEIPVFNSIPSVILPYVSSIDLSAASGKNIVAKPLFTTSPKTGRDDSFVILSIGRFENADKKALDTLFGIKEGLVVGATYTGKFNSFYTGKPVPKDTAKGSMNIDDYKTINESQKDSKMVLIGDGDFADENSKVPKENIIFFLNLVEYLSDDVGLSQIRTKEASDIPLPKIAESTKQLYKYLNVILPPSIILIIGFFVWNKRKIKKKNLQIKTKENEK